MAFIIIFLCHLPLVILADEQSAPIALDSCHTLVRRRLLAQRRLDFRPPAAQENQRFLRRCDGLQEQEATAAKLSGATAAAAKAASVKAPTPHLPADHPELEQLYQRTVALAAKRFFESTMVPLLQRDRGKGAIHNPCLNHVYYFTTQPNMLLRSSELVRDMAKSNIEVLINRFRVVNTEDYRFVQSFVQGVHPLQVGFRDFVNIQNGPLVQDVVEAVREWLGWSSVWGSAEQPVDSPPEDGRSCRAQVGGGGDEEQLGDGVNLTKNCSREEERGGEVPLERDDEDLLASADRRDPSPDTSAPLHSRLASDFLELVGHLLQHTADSVRAKHPPLEGTVRQGEHGSAPSCWRMLLALYDTFASAAPATTGMWQSYFRIYTPGRDDSFDSTSNMFPSMSPRDPMAVVARELKRLFTDVFEAGRGQHGSRTGNTVPRGCKNCFVDFGEQRA